MREGKPATSEPVNRRARAGIETTALEIGTGSQRSAITATTFHEMLRPATCFLRARTALQIISRKVSANKIAAYHSGATASVQRLAQLLPSQMSEPWHVSKPARQTGCRLRRSADAGLADGRRGDQRGQRTVGSVAFTVRSSRPGAEGLGLPNASPYSGHESNREKRKRQGTHDRESHRHKHNSDLPTTQDSCKACHVCGHYAAIDDRFLVEKTRQKSASQVTKGEKSRPLLRRVGQNMLHCQ